MIVHDYTGDALAIGHMRLSLYSSRCDLLCAAVRYAVSLLVKCPCALR